MDAHLMRRSRRVSVSALAMTGTMLTTLLRRLMNSTSRGLRLEGKTETTAQHHYMLLHGCYYGIFLPPPSIPSQHSLQLLLQAASSHAACSALQLAPTKPGQPGSKTPGAAGGEARPALHSD
ncbi:hypothetical protein EYF80_018818 [Liparis tanakae]|uniref:Uncharacterized protein n=1 Tax=Liparis tanakae TaxID=230148 RepID=A0A4Z2I183_9TELE|nr:hypothetical protein EYF80_018818 [Liparis tanakae]